MDSPENCDRGSNRLPAEGRFRNSFGCATEKYFVNDVAIAMPNSCGSAILRPE
jgi:hypothetical protein